MKKFLKVLGIIFASLLALVLVAAIVVGCIWFHEIKTVASIKQIASFNEEHRDGNVYVINYSGGYYFDDFIEQGGVSNDSELMAFIMNHITKGIEIPGVTSAGCSSYTCATEDGDRLFCRNFDLSKSNSAIILTNPGNGRYKSITTADLKYCGVSQNKTEISLIDKVKCLALTYAPMDGMNEKGLACSIYISYQGVYEDAEGKSHTTKTDISTDKPDITSTTMMRMVLDYCATVDEAIEMIEKYDLHDSSTNAFHYSLSDATGKAACLEWIYDTNATDLDGTNRTLHITYSDGTNPLVVTNHVIVEGYYASDDDKKGFDRMSDIKAELEKTGSVVSGVDEALDILSVAGVRTRVEAGKQEASAALTLWSVVYNLTDKTVTLCANEHYGEPEYTFTYSFDDFFKNVK